MLRFSVHMRAQGPRSFKGATREEKSCSPLGCRFGSRQLQPEKWSLGPLFLITLFCALFAQLSSISLKLCQTSLFLCAVILGGDFPQGLPGVFSDKSIGQRDAPSKRRLSTAAANALSY